MKKMSTVLIETTIQRVSHQFIQFDKDSGDLIGKCAMGVLGCESTDKACHLDKDHHSLWNQFDIMFRSYGINPEEFNQIPHVSSFDDKVYFSETMTLDSQIIQMSDSGRWTFKEIGEFLEVTYNL